MKRWIIGLMLLIPLLTAHASGGEVPTVPAIKILYASSNCRAAERNASISLLSRQQWQAFFDAQVFKPKVEPESLAGQIVLVNMGERSSAGYGIQLRQAATQSRDGRLRLPVVWTTPKPGMMQAQMITHPCLVVSVAADFQGVDAVDQNGNILLSTPKP